MASEVFLTPNGRSPSPEIDKVSQKTGIRCENTFTVRAGAAVHRVVERICRAFARSAAPSECAERLRERFRWAIARSAAPSVCA